MGSLRLSGVEVLRSEAMDALSGSGEHLLDAVRSRCSGATSTAGRGVAAHRLRPEEKEARPPPTELPVPPPSELVE